MTDAKVGVFRREPIEFAEEQLVEVIATGERFRFGRAEYSANWIYTVWCYRGNHMGAFHSGQLREVKKEFKC